MSNTNLFITEDEQDYILNGKYLEDFPGLQHFMHEPIFTIADLGIKPRDATYWDKNEILPELLGKGARRKYTLIQSVWIRLIVQFRRMDASIAVIKSFKEKLFDISIDLEKAFENPEILALMQKALEAQGIKADVKELLKKETTEGRSLTKSVGMLEGIILTTIALKKRIQFLVGLGGDYMPYSLDKHDYIINEIPKAKEFIEAPHYSISVWIAVLELMVKWQNETFFDDISLLSEEELKIIETIRKPNVKSIKVRLSNGEVSLIEKTVEEKLNPSTQVMDLIMRHGYQNIEIKTQNGKVVQYTNTVMEKIKGTK